MRACRLTNTPVTVAVSTSLVCLFLIDTLQINQTWYNNNDNSNNDRQQWHFLLFPHTISSCLNNFSFQYFLMTNESKTTAVLSHASLVVIDIIYTHSCGVLACLIVQNRPPYRTNIIKIESKIQFYLTILGICQFKPAPGTELRRRSCRHMSTKL